MTSESKSYKKTLKKWCDDSTMDGLPNIARAVSHHPAYLVFWVTLFTGCAGLAFYMVARSIMDYSNFDVITTDRMVPYEQFTYPVVTICNENMFLSPRANDFIRGYFFERFGVNVSSYQDIMNVTGGRQEAESEINWLIYQLNLGVWNETVLRSLGYTAEETFYYSEYTFKILNLTTDMQWYFDPVYGNCYRFNANQSLTIARLGYGLYVEMFTGLPYSLNKYILEPKTRGIVIEIKNYDNIPNVYRPIRIQPMKFNRISVSKSRSTTLAEPYSKCNSADLFSSPVFDEMKRLEIDYDKTLCMKAYLQYQVVQTFDCQSVNYAPWFNYVKPCTNRSIVDQIQPSMSDIDMDELNAMCPVDCDRESFDFSIATQTSPTYFWYRAIVFEGTGLFTPLFGNNTPGYDIVKRAYAAAWISFDRIMVEEISESPAILLSALLSNIGGTLNLFFGPSFLTATEIFELVFGFVGIWLARRKIWQVGAMKKNSSYEIKNENFDLDDDDNDDTASQDNNTTFNSQKSIL